MTRLILALGLAGSILNGMMVTDVNSPIETVWGVSDLQYRRTDSGIELSCTVEHHGAPTPGMALEMTLEDADNHAVATERVTEFQPGRTERIVRRLTVTAHALAQVRHARAQLAQRASDGNILRLWSGAITMIETR